MLRGWVHDHYRRSSSVEETIPSLAGGLCVAAGAFRAWNPAQIGSLRVMFTVRPTSCPTFGSGDPHRSILDKPLGHFAKPHEPVLGFQPGNQHQHSLRGDGRHERHQGERQSAAERLRRHPDDGAGPQGPTGQVNNTNTASFQLTPGTASTSSRFIFANLNGTISGWAGGQNSTVVATTPGAVYTGLAINTAQDRLYAANSAAGRIDVFDSSFAPVSLPGAFTDPNLPAGFVPFNVQNIGGKVYVTYAPPGRARRDRGDTGHGSRGCVR